MSYPHHRQIALAAAITIAFGSCKAFDINVGTKEPIKLDPIQVDLTMRVDVYQYSGNSEDKKQEVKNKANAHENLRNRMAEIQTLKNSRYVGENRLGLLSIRNLPAGKDGEYVQQTVDAENADRTFLMTDNIQLVRPPAAARRRPAPTVGDADRRFVRGRMDRGRRRRRGHLPLDPEEEEKGGWHNPMTSAIIVAAGTSQRMGFDKLLAPLGGWPVIKHTIDAFENCPDISEIIVITNDERFKAIERLEHEECYQKLTHLIHGGAERHHSVWNGLKELNPHSQYVAVHDGARPLITPAQITRCIEAAKLHRAAASAHPITDTVKRADDSQQVSAPVDRDKLWAMETPQVFEVALLVEAYEKILEAGNAVTDEVSAVEQLGHPIQLVPNPAPNPKITYPEDLATAEKLLP